MRKFLQWLLRKPITWLANRVSSAPDREEVFSSLSQLLERIRRGDTNAGIRLPYDLQASRFVIVSDQHKGARDAADDFRGAEKNFLAALDHYDQAGFSLVNLGDCEELWENKPAQAIRHNREVLEREARFLRQNRYYRTFGNHDLEWKYDYPRNQFLKPIFGAQLRVLEGLILEINHGHKIYSIFLTHGHQGDKKSDGNPFSTWVVAALWTPLQRYLEISINTTATSYELVDRHNIIMYEWSTTQADLLYISGHTHKPVFSSLDHIERLSQLIGEARQAGDQGRVVALEAELEKRKAEYAGKQVRKTMARPSYFNTGCCCFSDGDITAIELEQDAIRLVKWTEQDGVSHRQVLEECPLSFVLGKLDLAG